jgi:hypothetical protein
MWRASFHIGAITEMLRIGAGRRSAVGRADAVNA